MRVDDEGPRRVANGEDATDAPACGEVLVDVRGVSRSYEGVRAVRDVTFSIGAGEIVGLLGPNGAGKTTTLRMLATLLRPDAGSVRIAGFDVVAEALAARRALGYQTGDTGLYGRLTPVEFLRYFGRLHGMEAAALERRVGVLVEGYGLGSFAQRRCSTLSTGQKQRVSLARAMLHDPSVLLLDEPTAGLDIIASSFVQGLLEDARQRGKAILFSTHILSEVELLADRVLVLHAGEILARGTVAELLALTGESAFSRAYLSLVRQRQVGATE